MAESFKIIQEDPLLIEINVDGATKTVSYSGGTEESILAAIRYEMTKMKFPKEKTVLVAANVGKNITFKETKTPKPIEYDVEYSTEVKA